MTTTSVIDRSVGLTGLDDRPHRRSKLATFRLVFCIHMTVGLGLWAWQLWSGWRQSLVLPLLASVALVAVTRWVRVGLLIILGGMVVKVGSRQIDTSLKTKLSSLKLALKEVG